MIRKLISIEKYHRLTFFPFQRITKKMSSTETHGDFRLDFLYDERGKRLWDDNLFLNIYDFWCVRRNGFLLKDYRTKNSLLKRIISKKMRGNKELPTYKVMLRMCPKREEQFNPMEYLHGDWEDYLHILRKWKKVCEEDFLIQHPRLREPKIHIKTNKIYIN